MKIRDHVLTLTFIGLLGAFALAFLVGWLNVGLGADADLLMSELSEDKGAQSGEKDAHSLGLA